MLTLEVLETDFKRYIPSDLSECTPTQYIEMSELIFNYQAQRISFDELKVQAIYKLLNMKPKKAKFDHQETNKMINVSLLADLIDSFFTINEDVYAIIKQDYTHNPVPYFATFTQKVYGPSDNFTNITFGEYSDALRIFHDYHATGETNLLYILAAVFYRPKKSFLFFKKRLENYDGDIRKPYNSSILEQTAHDLKNLPIGFVYGTYLLFASFQKYLIDAKILWGGNEIDLAILFEQSKSTQNNQTFPGIGMDSIAFSMAESGSFGTFEQVRKTNFWQTLIRMYDSRITDIQNKKKSDDTNK